MWDFNAQIFCQQELRSIAIISDHYFTKVGDSLVKYEDDFLAYHEAKERCEVAYGANLVEFRNEREWTEVSPCHMYRSDTTGWVKLGKIFFRLPNGSIEQAT